MGKGEKKKHFADAKSLSCEGSELGFVSRCEQAEGNQEDKGRNIKVKKAGRDLEVGRRGRRAGREEPGRRE